MSENPFHRHRIYDDFYGIIDEQREFALRDVATFEVPDISLLQRTIDVDRVENPMLQR